MKKCIMAMVFFVLTCALYAQSVIVTPAASIGYYSAYGDDESKGLSYSYGARALLSANELQRYGILIDALTLNHHDENTTYIRTGIYLEQVLFRCFNMGIGTVGYINVTNDEASPFGLYTHLGFEYPFTKRFHAAAYYQSEFIFAAPVISNHAFMISFSVLF